MLRWHVEVNTQLFRLTEARLMFAAGGGRRGFRLTWKRALDQMFHTAHSTHIDRSDPQYVCTTYYYKQWATRMSAARSYVVPVFVHIDRSDSQYVRRTSNGLQ